jgi:L-iditol 2-dehydrogenase
MTASSMPALVLDGPRRMAVREVPVPELASGEVLVEVRAAGVCMAELSSYLGISKQRVYPVIMGHEAAGRVASAAPGALFADGSAAREGTGVAIDPLLACGACEFCRAGRANFCPERRLLGKHRPGAFARFVAVPAALCHPIPAALSPVIAALSEPLATAIHAVDIACGEGGESGAGSQEAGGKRRENITSPRLPPPESLLVLGAGPIGLFCILAAKARGVPEIIVSEIDGRRAETARRFGAAEVLDPRAEDLPAAVRRITAGGAEAAVDTAGAAASRGDAINALRSGGRAVFVGLGEEASALPVGRLVRHEAALLGSFAYTRFDFRRAIGMLVSGAAPAGWVEERTLAQGAAAHEELASGADRAIKIVLKM